MKLVTTSPMRRGAYLGLAMLLCMGSASAQVYKWVDANGKTHFTDKPPPASAKPAQVRAASAASSSAGFPYALATAARNFPVTLYTTASCAGCDQGRTLLKARGIPFTEKTVSNDADEQKLKEAGGNGGMPFMTVGSAKVNGFQASAWNAMLNVALYPETKMLPASYQYPTAVAAAPTPAPAKAAEPDQEAVRMAAAEAEAKRRKDAAAKQKPTAPPGFQF